MNFDQRELRTILAALRYWQAWMLAHPGLDPDLAEGLTTNPSLTIEEIDELFERLAAL